MATCYLPAPLWPICLEGGLFSAGLKSAKGIHHSLSSLSALPFSWPRVTWVSMVGPGADLILSHFPDVALWKAHLPPSRCSPGSLLYDPAVPPVLGIVTSCLCLIHGWGFGMCFPRKARTPLGSCPVPAWFMGPRPKSQPPPHEWARE